MKKFQFSLLALTSLLTSCSYNDATGKHEVSIMFWFFIAGISITLIILIILLCKKYPKKKK